MSEFEPMEQEVDYAALKLSLPKMQKRKWLWWLLTIIPGVHLIAGAFLIRTRNTIKVIKSEGRKEPGGLLNIIILLWCLIIPPILVNKVLDNVNPKVEDWIIGLDPYIN